MNEALLQELRAVGAAQSAVRWLDKPSPDTLDYIDLFVSPAQIGRVGLSPSCVIENDGHPLIYVLDATSLVSTTHESNGQILSLVRKLACRGGTGFLAVSQPGLLNLYALDLRRSIPSAVSFQTKDSRNATLVQDLAAGAWPEALTGQDRATRQSASLGIAIHELLFKLLTQAADELSKCQALRHSPDDVLSLVGRALFARFLIDRDLMGTGGNEYLGPKLEECFSSANRAAKTCRWLDKTFNGDLLPLKTDRYEIFFEELGDDSGIAFGALSKILYRTPTGQLDFELLWNDINFAHVPIGLLSEVYERFAHSIDSHLAKAESIHYTPQRVAALMVEEALDGVTTCKSYEARCLDPAAGGGVFLVLLLRRLVAEQWRETGNQPSRPEVERILYQQLRGFDINISALKMAALSLYLTVLELDPSPASNEGRQFSPLVGKFGEDAVLTVVRHANEPHPDPFILGSLGSTSLEQHSNRFDVVIGNPPWTAPKVKPSLSPSERSASKERLRVLQNTYTQITRRVASSRDRQSLHDIATNYINPDGVPDLAFVWRAMEWAKPHGVIAFALHARLMFKRTPAGKAAQDAVFRALRVTGAINGAALRQTDVWPNVDAPWVLLFAVNEIPNDDNVFYFVSPMLETPINRQSRMRIDYGAAEPVEFGVFRRDPALAKTLFRGTALDTDIVRRQAKVKTTPIGQYWAKKNLISGEGYQKGSGKSVAALFGRPDLRARSNSTFLVDVRSLPRFELPTVRRNKPAGFFKGPFVLFPEAPGDREQGGILLALDDLVFSESHYGYSIASAAESDTHEGNRATLDLAYYLYVVGYSSLFQYSMLMTSSKFGVERDAILKEDVDGFPLVPLENLDNAQLESVRSLAKQIASGQKPWSSVDQFVGDLYSLSANDLRVIADTLSVSLPFGPAKARAQNPPSTSDVEMFRASVEEGLKGFLSVLEYEVRVTAIASPSTMWRFFGIGLATEHSLLNSSYIPEWISNLADNQGASKIVVRLSQGGLVLGLLAEGRYWTHSRARLCVSDLVREHGDAFSLHTST